MARSPAYAAHPEHTLEFDEARTGLRVFADGERIAETRRGLVLREGRYPAVVYVPRADVEMTRLEASEQSTHCPFKGDASYFKLAPSSPSKSQDDVQPSAVEPVAWSYEDPFDEMEALRDHLAFYPDRVRLEPFEL